MMGSERFGAAVSEDHDDAWSCLENKTSFRLKDYWMSDNEIQWLACDALDFAKRQRAKTDATVSVIPVVVELDVCTVQQDSEPINTAIDRAIRPQCLIPEGIMHLNQIPYLARKIFLMELARVRVEDEVGLAMMEVCPVCSLSSIIGAQISFFPYCKHACHSHCVFEWLRKRNTSCPVCGVRTPTDWERLISELDSSNSGYGSDSDVIM